MMKAWTKTRYGGPEVLKWEEVPKPVPANDELLVRVKANSVNAADWHVLRGSPYFARVAFGLFKPKAKVLGADFAGVIEDKGSDVRDFEVGDRVFGESMQSGAFGEYVSVPARVCARMHDEADFCEMAGVPIAGLTAVQAIVTHGQLREGESILINGASGGVGHFSVQIAKALGGRVTGVCSERNMDFVKEMGADEVIAYDRENIHEHPGEYDLILDNHGNLIHSDYQRMGKRGVVVGFTTLSNMVGLMLKNSFSKFPLISFTAKANTEDLYTLAGLIKDGKIKTYIDRKYSNMEIPEAMRLIETMRARGKVVMEWNQQI